MLLIVTLLLFSVSAQWQPGDPLPKKSAFEELMPQDKTAVMKLAKIALQSPDSPYKTLFQAREAYADMLPELLKNAAFKQNYDHLSNMTESDLYTAVFGNGPKTRRQKRSTDAVNQQHEHLGENGDFKHCENGREVSQLSVDVFPDLSLVHPSVKLQLDEIDGSFAFSAELPYLPFDAKYLVSFQSELSDVASERDRCGSHYSQQFERLASASSLTPGMKWGHAPNANYEDAFSSSERFGAYYQSPDSYWAAAPAGCSHFILSADFSMDALIQDCVGPETTLALTTLADGVLAVSGKLSISVVKAAQFEEFDETGWKDGELVATWTHPFVILVDEFDSKIAVLDSANGGLRTRIQHATNSRWHENSLQRVETVVRSARVNHDKLQLVLQTVIYDAPDKTAHVHVRNMTLAHIGKSKHHHGTFSLQLADESSEEPYCIDEPTGLHRLTLQNWHLVSTENSPVYDSDFVLLFCDQEATVACDESEAMHRSTLSIRISSPRVFDNNPLAFHSEITQHLLSEENNQLLPAPLTEAIESGSRVCMETYVIGPKQLTSQLDVELVSAWLCTDDNYETSETELLCSERPHSVQLAGEGVSNTTQSRLNVTVVHPGLYGMMSVAVCFNSDARFTDELERSVVETNQRYESHIRMKSATLRRQGPVVLKAVFAALSAAAQVENRKSSHLKSQNLQKGAFASYGLEKALASSRVRGLSTETHAHRFEINPRQEDVHVVSGMQATLAVVIIVLSVLCAFCGALLIMWRRESLRKPVYGLIPHDVDCPIHK